MRAHAPHIVRILLTLLGFTLIGPLVGLVLIVSLGFFLGALHPVLMVVPFGAFWLLGPATISLAYLLGALPAVASAIAYLAAKRLERSTRIAASIVTGATTSAVIPGLAIGGLDGFFGTAVLALLFELAIVGGLVAAGCSFLAELLDPQRYPGR